MAIVPSNTQFRGDTTGVPIVDKGSASTNKRAEYFTMADIAESAGPTTNNTVYGLNAFQNNTSGNNNTAIGETALRDNTTGYANIAVGVGALQRSTTGIENTAIGLISFLFNDNGSRNTSLGAYTGYNSRTSDNTYIGYRSGQESWNGVENTAVGSEAHKSVWNSNAENNVAIGRSSLIAISNGDDNTAVGYQSGINITTASSNTIVGAYADAANFSSSVILGREATATGSNQFVVGSALYNAGAVTTAAAAQTKTWDVIINGVAEKILLA